MGEVIVCPIYKAGPQYDPNKYRGMSITTTMYTIFSNIINQRLYRWAAEDKTCNKIDECQTGFRHSYSAIDNVCCLQAMAQKYLSRQGGRFYCLYVDFRKAFDKIDHHKLFERLKIKV